MHARLVPFAVAIVLCAFADRPASAQMVTIGMPSHSVGHRFHEGSNIGWSLRGNNWSARFGGGGFPAFGGFNPNAGLSTGMGFGAGGMSGNMSLNFSQGGSSTFTSTTPMLTVTNGVPGYMFIGRTAPFVTGYVPTVGGGFYSVPSPFVDLGPANTVGGRMRRGELDRSALRATGEAIVDSPAGRTSAPAASPTAPRENVIDLAVRPLVDPVPAGPASLAARKSAEAGAAAEKARDYLARGRAAEERGKPQVARVYYQTARQWATGELRDEIAARLRTPATEPPPARAAR